MNTFPNDFRIAATLVAKGLIQYTFLYQNELYGPFGITLKLKIKLGLPHVYDFIAIYVKRLGLFIVRKDAIQINHIIIIISGKEQKCHSEPTNDVCNGENKLFR